MKSKIEFFVYKKGVAISNEALPIMGHISLSEDKGEVIEADLLIKLDSENKPDKFDLFNVKMVNENFILNIVGDYSNSPLKGGYDQLAYKDLLTIQEGYSYQTFAEKTQFICGIKALKVSSCIKGEHSYLFFGMVEKNNLIGVHHPMVVFYSNNDEFETNSITKHTTGNNIYDALIEEPCFGFGRKLIIDEKITIRNSTWIYDKKNEFLEKHVSFDPKTNKISLINIPKDEESLIEFKILGKKFSFIDIYDRKIEPNDFLNYYMVGKEKYNLFSEPHKGWIEETLFDKRMDLNILTIKELNLI